MLVSALLLAFFLSPGLQLTPQQLQGSKQTEGDEPIQPIESEDTSIVSEDSSAVIEIQDVYFQEMLVKSRKVVTPTWGTMRGIHLIVEFTYVGDRIALSGDLHYQYALLKDVEMDISEGVGGGGYSSINEVHYPLNVT